MKVIGSGFGRTGTLSLKEALEELGFGPCYHMAEIFKRPYHLKYWRDIAMNKTVNYHKIFSKFQATVDFPASVMYKELLEVYPDAKIIHTVRNPQRWYDSTYETIYQVRNLFTEWVKKHILPVRWFLEMTNGMFWDRIFKGQFENRAQMVAIFNQYTETVKKTVPANQLLVFSVKEGWGPLCRFLDVPIPDKPFPHINEKKKLLQRFRMIKWLAYWGPVAGACIAILILPFL